MGTSLTDIQTAIPGLLIWLRRVFWVMGGYMFATGLLTCYVALTAFRGQDRGGAIVIAFSGFASVGVMAAVNFIIGSDFRWLILSLVIPWMWAWHFTGAREAGRERCFVRQRTDARAVAAQH